MEDMLGTKVEVGDLVICTSNTGALKMAKVVKFGKHGQAYGEVFAHVWSKDQVGKVRQLGWNLLVLKVDGETVPWRLKAILG